MRSSIEEALKSTFRPEFLNRIDDIIIFEALSAEQIGRIVDLVVKEVEARLAARRVSVSLTAAAKEWLAKEGYDPVYGARPLRRAVQRCVENPLSTKILAGDLSEGDHVAVDADSEGLTFTKAESPVAVAT